MNVMARPTLQPHREAQQLQAIGWAVTHAPTREAYRRCTGEDAGPILDRYLHWCRDNLIGDDR